LGGLGYFPNRDLRAGLVQKVLTHCWKILNARTCLACTKCRDSETTVGKLGQIARSDRNGNWVLGPAEWGFRRSAWQLGVLNGMRSSQASVLPLWVVILMPVWTYVNA
jgi:hypothetical protein